VQKRERPKEIRFFFLAFFFFLINNVTKTQNFSKLDVKLL
jgi:hypothetical protein